MLSSSLKKLANLIGYNLIWALCIFWGNQGLILVGMLLVLHFVLISERLFELKIIIITASLGYGIDCLLTLAGFFEFEQVQGVTPLWLAALWLGFCTTLRHSLAVFADKLMISSVLAAIAGTSSYMGAAHLGAVQMGQSNLVSVLILALIWAVLFPSLMWISHSFRRSHVG